MTASSSLQEQYRAIPSVQELLQDNAWQPYQLHPAYLKQIIQEEIQSLRGSLSANKPLSAAAIPQQLHQRIQARLDRLTGKRLRRVVNGSGIILHTNMGRAPLPEAARNALMEAAENYVDLEIDLATGKRGSRTDIVEELLCLLTGAEAALMVNNCAAAIFLALNSLCQGKEVPVSRGELVEIGGSFRMPDVMQASGAQMVEIGTTNKTHLKDYRRAIGSATGGILKVHTSNYRILGFTGETGLADLVALAHDHQLPLLYDMGSGVLEDLQQWGYPHEPLAREVLAQGVDVITFSGDKILGGPQAGIIAGRRQYIEQIKDNHLTRALRCDKLIYAAMAATLPLYLQPETLPQRLPVARMLTVDNDSLRRRGEAIVKRLAGQQWELTVVEAFSQMGSGALPLEKIPSIALKITGPLAPLQLSHRLRQQELPIVGYVQDDALYLNLRTVRNDEDELIVQALILIGD